MKPFLKKILKKPSTLLIVAIGYLCISICNIVAFFNSNILGDTVYLLWGNHSIFLFPYLGLLIASELNSSALALVMVLCGVVSIILILVSYILIIRCRDYRLLRITVFCDVAFSVIFICSNCIYSGLLDVHLIMLTGTFLNLLYGFYLHRCIHRVIPLNT